MPDIYLFPLQTYVDLFSPAENSEFSGPRIALTNTTTLIISLISIAFLVINEEVVKVIYWICDICNLPKYKLHEMSKYIVRN